MRHFDKARVPNAHEARSFTGAPARRSTPSDADILDLLTATVSRTIGDFARFKSARDAAESIQRALATRGPIEQAKGMLMAIHGIDADQAFDRLRTHSQHTNTPLRTVATTFIEHISTTTPTAATRDDSVDTT